MTQQRFFEDFSVDQIIDAGSFLMSGDDIKAFSRESDPQFFHVDDEAAKSSMFGGLIASGWQTAALTMKQVIDSTGPFEQGIVGAGVEIEWRQPVRPGDLLSVVAEVLDLAPARNRRDRGFVRLRMTTRNQNGVIVQVMTARIMAPKRPV